MDKNLENHDLRANTVVLKAHMRVIKTGQGKRSKKCNQCDYASSEAGILRRHLKTHSGEKLNKCSQCDYASSLSCNFQRHLKTHSGEKQTNAASVTMHPFKHVTRGNVWERIVKKSQANVTNVSLHPLWQAI